MTEAKWAEVDNDPGLIFTLQSIQRNAPWARHIYVLQKPSVRERLEEEAEAKPHP